MSTSIDLARFARFVLVGVLTSAAYVVVYLLLSRSLPPTAANVVAYALTAAANVVLNRRATFGVRGSAGASRQHAQAIVLFALALATTELSLGAVRAAGPAPSAALETVVLLASTAVAGTARYLALSLWVFGTSFPGSLRRVAPVLRGARGVAVRVPTTACAAR